MQNEPILLGEKLAGYPRASVAQPDDAPQLYYPQTIGVLWRAAHIALLTGVTCLPLWWALARPEAGVGLGLGLGPLLLVLLWLFAAHVPPPRSAQRREERARAPQMHPLLAGDRQKFMGSLRLDAKTVIIDGSNIYHFGQDHGFGAQPLAGVVRQLRAEGYRVVCFFDANIFYRLEEFGTIESRQRHLPSLLEAVFGLRHDEIYVVPSGTEADEYILMSLKHLPVSFALTNDQYRDYAKRFATVMKGNLWRKGLILSKNEIKIMQHRLQNPIRMSA